ncbi:fungal-specific transcription factor domain-containing protein [Xylariales sp. AK1849]|nr:fungal-specific transcription factor domain-containing protein [Xylariales sp. AK1849]
MFYSFSSSPKTNDPLSRRNPKRTKVSRACNYCKDHRVRCDVEIPCSRCVAANVECSLASSSSILIPPGNLPLPQADALLIRGAVASPEEPDASSSGQETTIAGTEFPNPIPASDKPEGMDSTVGFMSRIHAFCSTISQLSSDSPDDSPPPYPSSDQSMLVNTSKAPYIVLSKSRYLHLLDVYWARCHALNPILGRPQVDAICQTLWAHDGSSVQSSPLTDAAVALSLLHLERSGLKRRLLGFDRSHENLSLTYFQRCLVASSEYAFAEPSIDHVQCYVLMTLYLLDAGQHRPAYNIIGQAVRIAHLLDLHRGLPDTEPNAHLARRVWWTVTHLDFRCSRLLGRPVAVQLANVTCPLPAPGEFVYHTRAISLSRATQATMEALFQYPSRSHRNRIEEIESRACDLSAEVYRVLDWCRDQLRPALNRGLHLDHMAEHDSILETADSNPSQLLKDNLLEMQYYDAIIGLHRPFITFPNRSLIPQRSPQADKHATTAVHNAIATIDLAHRVMSTTDVLYGRGDVHEWQWNALLTLIGFLMAHPTCDNAPAARRHVELALEIFGAAHPANTVAIQATALTRSLRAKVDNLLQMLQSGTLQAASPHLNQCQGKGSDSSSTLLGTPHPTSDASWSWTDMIDLDALSPYNGEGTEGTIDFPDLPFMDDRFTSVQ